MILRLLEDGAPTNSAGGGAVAGIGVGPQGEPPVTRRTMLKRKMLEILKRKS